MAEIHESISVNARAERVFDIVDDEQKYPSYVPNVTGVADVVRSQGRVGDSVRIIYKVLGVTFDEKFTVKVHQRPSRIGSTFKGGMTGTFDWRFEPQAEQTRVTVDVNYKLAGGAVGKAVDAMLLERTNQKTIQQMLQNLSRLATEAKAAGPA